MANAAQDSKTDRESREQQETREGTSKPKNRRRSPRNEAILIAPNDRLKYSEILKGIKEKIQLQNYGVEIKAIRKTRKGDILVEINAEKQGKSTFGDAIRHAIGEEENVRDLVPRAVIEIRDIDETTEEPEIRQALIRAIEAEEEDYGSSADLNIKISNKPFRGMLRAEVEMNEKVAMKLDKRARIKVGWVSCRVRLITRVTRCYRCQGYGHVAATCKGPDRKENCWKCGQVNHRAAECENAPNCQICRDQAPGNQTDHMPGSAKCKSFLEELRRVRDRGRR